MRAPSGAASMGFAWGCVGANSNGNGNGNGNGKNGFRLSPE
ncbi:lipoprotein [Lysobacter enzymogenes]|uniref:Lipoprotein n=1 Tax=Lysobacter enzymogenes TaxID=69 RepID=A0A0S2DQK3_LYSEN|nr:lipoprotein [Lysobacter enzymogenes]